MASVMLWDTEKLVLLLEDLYNESLSAIIVDNELSDWFEVTVE